MLYISQIKQLRDETGAGPSDCKKALTEAKNDLERAKEILRKWGKELAGKKSAREAKIGIVDCYVHPNRRVGTMVKLLCETDFVAKSDDFKKLAHELCLQIAAMDPKEDYLLSQPWIKDETKTIKDLIEEYIAKMGENIEIKKFTRFEI